MAEEVEVVFDADAGSLPSATEGSASPDPEAPSAVRWRACSSSSDIRRACGRGKREKKVGRGKQERIVEKGQIMRRTEEGRKREDERGRKVRCLRRSKR